MKEYICIVTSELASYKNDYISSMTWHTSFEEAVSYGKSEVDILRAYPASADFFVYKSIEIPIY